MTIGYTIVYPTLHNFIVNPANESCVSIIIIYILFLLLLSAPIFHSCMDIFFYTIGESRTW